MGKETIFIIFKSSKMFPVVRNLKTSDLYEFCGGNTFKNLRTGATGEVTDEVARKSFVINVEASMIIDEYPIVKELIQKLGLKFQKQ